MRYSYPVQKLYKDTARNMFFLEQDITSKNSSGLSYNRKGIIYHVGHDQYEQVGASMEHTKSADKYSNYELTIIEKTYPGLGLRYFLARETYSEPYEHDVLVKKFHEMIEKIQP